MERAAHRRWLPVVLVWALGTTFLSFIAWRDWLPHDDGMLAHAAERVLHGELPHRDFDGMYTGGLEWLHAFAFRLFGVQLTSLRLVLLTFASLFLPVFYSLAARVLRPAGAILATLVALLWSLPVYFASLPSWYILFFSTFGLAALLRFFDTGHRRWLLAVGLFGGLAILMKVNGAFFLGAAVFALLFADLSQEPVRSGAPQITLPSLIIWAGCALLTLGLLSIVVRNPGLSELVHYALPGGLIAAVLAITEAKRGGLPTRERLGRWGRLLAPVALGVALPIVLWLLPYVFSGSVGSVVYGLFVLPQRRLSMVDAPFPPTWTLLLSLPLAALLWFGPKVAVLRERRTALVAGLMLLIVALCGMYPSVYLPVCLSVRVVIPVAIAAGSAVLLRQTELPAQRQRELFAVLVTTAFVGLIQYPFPTYLYFCYVLPLAVLAVAYLVASQPLAPRPLHGVVAGFLAVFGALWVAPSSSTFVGQTPERLPYASIPLARAGIEVPEPHLSYQEVIETVVQHSPPGSAIFATPDLPEVYFLADRQNVTRTMYDLFDADYGQPEREQRLLKTLRERDVKAVVIRAFPPFSQPVSESFFKALLQQYPERKEIDRFLVMWRP